jgi:predicted RecB family nuclease
MDANRGARNRATDREGSEMTKVVLGGYPAKQCARATYNKHSPASPQADSVPELEGLFTEGKLFETDVVDELRVRFGDEGDVLFISEELEWDRMKSTTVEAMKSGCRLIVGGRLPDVNGRVGAPDILLRFGQGYLPIDIKNHRTLGSGKKDTTFVSSLEAPGELLNIDGYSNRGSKWRDDTMQLAHYTRMLQELGFHSGSDRDSGGMLLGGILGTSDFTSILDDPFGITWYELSHPHEETFSASADNKRAKRTPLERYDHEFNFRIKVAHEAIAGREGVVRPYRIKECDTCGWFNHCTTVVGPDDASFAIETGHLNVRQWQHLYGPDHKLTVHGLAGLDPAATGEAFKVHSVGTTSSQKRLENAVRRARMTLAGIDFEPIGKPEAVPAADIEVDFDIEWDKDGRIYQWGLRIRHAQDDSTADYRPIVSFDKLDEEAETGLAEQFAAAIRELKADALREGKTLAIYHWSHVEVSRTKKFAPVAEVLDSLTVDLQTWFDSNYFARTSSSIKKIARLFDFTWDVDDPGGRRSQEYLEIARTGGAKAESAQKWCLSYNEDDVAAQAAIRDGLRRYELQQTNRTSN